MTEQAFEMGRDLAKWANEPLAPELRPYVEDSSWGKMLRHPLVYSIPLVLPGQANEALRRKTELLDKAIDEEEWHTVVFLHERAYRVSALIDYCTGRDLDGDPLPLSSSPEYWDLAMAVWRDSENIEQHVEDWRALFADGEGLMLFDTEDAEGKFNALPDPIPAWRGGNVGDWSWSTERSIAEFFARRHKLYARPAMIPKSDVFGYLLARGESELLVKMTAARRRLVYPKMRLE